MNGRLTILLPGGRRVRSTTLFIVALTVALVGLLLGYDLAGAQTMDGSLSIISVDPGVSVTIGTTGFPDNKLYNVLLDQTGNNGIGGQQVGNLVTGTGGNAIGTYLIPEALQDEVLLAIRLENSDGTHYKYDFFTNQTALSSAGGGEPTGFEVGIGESTPGVTGFEVGINQGLTGFEVGINSVEGTNATESTPLIAIAGVSQDRMVTVQAFNFPTNQMFTVTMGQSGTEGIGGTAVAYTSSGEGSSFYATYNIPNSLKGNDRIAIRLESPQGFYSYNWFYNQNFPLAQ